MLDYAHQRAKEALKLPRQAVFVTQGPAGIQASQVQCQAVDLILYLLVPKTSDHLFNLESESSVVLLAAGLDLKGNAQVIPIDSLDFELELLKNPQAGWCVLVRVEPIHLHIHRAEGWGNLESIDVNPE